MSAIGGAGGRRPDLNDALQHYEQAIEESAKPESSYGERVSKREMEKALDHLKPHGKLDLPSRMDVVRAMAEKALTQGAKDAVIDYLRPMHEADTGTASSAAALGERFESLAEGLWYSSEGDYPLKAFSRPLEASTALTTDTFREALGLPEGTPVEFESADDFFRDMQDPDYNSAEDRAKFKALENAMRDGLTDLQFVRVHGEDVVEAPVYVIGRTPQGGIAGLESIRVWT
ncbi:nuclease A inhibitor family protein [Planctomycetota bacterium]